VSLVEQERLTLRKHLRLLSVFVGFLLLNLSSSVNCFVDCCLSFFFWPLFCLPFFDLRHLITPLVFPDFSYIFNIQSPTGPMYKHFRYLILKSSLKYQILKRLLVKLLRGTYKLHWKLMKEIYVHFQIYKPQSRLT